MESGLQQFMVDFTLPQNLSETFVSFIPQQRAVVNRLITEGKLLNYALSLENAKLWAVFSVHSESELMELISCLPLSRFMKVRINELTFFNSATAYSPAFSVN